MRKKNDILIFSHFFFSSILNYKSGGRFQKEKRKLNNKNNKQKTKLKYKKILEKYLKIVFYVIFFKLSN